MDAPLQGDTGGHTGTAPTKLHHTLQCAHSQQSLRPRSCNAIHHLEMNERPGSPHYIPKCSRIETRITRPTDINKCRSKAQCSSIYLSATRNESIVGSRLTNLCKRIFHLISKICIDLGIMWSYRFCCCECKTLVEYMHKLHQFTIARHIPPTDIAGRGYARRVAGCLIETRIGGGLICPNDTLQIGLIGPVVAIHIGCRLGQIRRRRINVLHKIIVYVLPHAINQVQRAGRSLIRLRRLFFHHDAYWYMCARFLAQRTNGAIVVEIPWVFVFVLQLPNVTVVLLKGAERKVVLPGCCYCAPINRPCMHICEHIRREFRRHIDIISCMQIFGY